MDRYKVLSEIGTGTYGKVLRARRRADGLVVAVKALKKAEAALSWGDVLRTREVEALKQLQHPSIIRLIEVIREEGGRIYLVMEHAAHGDLLGWLKRRQHQTPHLALPSPATVRTIMRPLLAALAYLHARGFCHRDVKPENILLAEGGPPGRDADFPYTLKLCDFGLARRAAGAEANPAPFTPYVSTRWYRAPEILLRAKAQTAAVDVWAAGCLTAEVFSLQPLLPGESQLDQLTKTAALLGGGPTPTTWPAGAHLVQQLKLRLPQPFPPGAAPPLLHALPPHAPPEATDLLCRMLAYDPARRIPAEEALRHAFIAAGALSPPLTPATSASSSAAASLPLEAVDEEVIEEEDEEEDEDGAHDLSVLMGEAGPDTSVPMAGDAEESDEDEEDDDDHDVMTLLAGSQPSASFASAAASQSTVESEDEEGGVIDEEEEAEEHGAGRSSRPLSWPSTGSGDASPSPSPSPSPEQYSPDVKEQQAEEEEGGGASDDDDGYDDDEPSPPFAATRLPPPQPPSHHRLGPLHGLTLRAPSFSPPWKQQQQQQQHHHRYQQQQLPPLPPPPLPHTHSHLPFLIASQPPLASLPRAPRAPPQAAQPPPSGAWTTPAASLFGAEGGLGNSSRSAVTTSSSNSSGGDSGDSSGVGRKKGSFLGRIKGLDGLKHPLFLSPSPPQRKKKASRRGSPGFWPK